MPKPTSTRKQKRDWLVLNSHTWEGLELTRKNLLEILKLMAKAGLFDENNIYTANIIPLIEGIKNPPRCRYAMCMKPPHSNGLCSKHRRWVDKGNMTDDLVVLKPVAQKNIYKHAKCKIDGCERRPRRNWMCEKHSSLYREGYITKTGDRIIKKRAVKKYPKDFGCVVCGKKGKISKGFCNYHYEHYRKGVIGFDGVKIGELKRVHKYSIDSMCKAEGCNRKPRCKGWCERCRIWLVRGYYSNNGKLLKSLPISRNKGRKCSIPSCEKPAHCKTLCRLHYVRKQTGYIGPSGRKNKGQKCSEKNCQRPAACRTMCSLHYYRFKVQNKEQFFKKANLPEQQST